jgi:hypothetical protein
MLGRGHHDVNASCGPPWLSGRALAAAGLGLTEGSGGERNFLLTGALMFSIRSHAALKEIPACPVPPHSFRPTGFVVGRPQHGDLVRPGPSARSGSSALRSAAGAAPPRRPETGFARAWCRKSLKSLIPRPEIVWRRVLASHNISVPPAARRSPPTMVTDAARAMRSARERRRKGLKTLIPRPRMATPQARWIDWVRPDGPERRAGALRSPGAGPPSRAIRG